MEQSWGNGTVFGRIYICRSKCGMADWPVATLSSVYDGVRRVPNGPWSLVVRPQRYASTCQPPRVISVWASRPCLDPQSGLHESSIETRLVV